MFWRYTNEFTAAVGPQPNAVHIVSFWFTVPNLLASRDSVIVIPYKGVDRAAVRAALARSAARRGRPGCLWIVMTERRSLDVGVAALFGRRGCRQAGQEGRSERCLGGQQKVAWGPDPGTLVPP